MKVAREEDAQKIRRKGKTKENKPNQSRKKGKKGKKKGKGKKGYVLCTVRTLHNLREKNTKRLLLFSFQKGLIRQNEQG